VHSLTPVSRLLYVPTGHAEQEREAESEYFPFLHAVQSAAFIPPARSLHSQSQEAGYEAKTTRARAHISNEDARERSFRTMSSIQRGESEDEGLDVPAAALTFPAGQATQVELKL
jgi:hypothetical protein